MRLFLTFFVALLLLGSPGAAKSLPAARCSTAMAGPMNEEPDNHSKMDCCTPDCSMASAAALPDTVPFHAGVFGLDRDLTWTKAADRLPSVVLGGDDPPPRTFFS